MAWKDWLDKARDRVGGSAPSEEDLSINDLVALERYPEAIAALRKHLERRKADLKARQKLADLLVKTGERADALEEYLTVADSYSREGFFDKARAVLTNVNRRFPGLQQVEVRLQRIDRTRRLDELRRNVVGAVPMKAAMRIERLWKHIVEGKLVERLSEEQLVRVLPALAMTELAEGKQLAAAGERREELWWIVEGEISARVERGGGAATEVRSFGPGALIGERALLEQQPWPASYVAAKKSAALVLTRDNLATLLTGEDDPRGLLDALRAEHNDEAVAELVGKIKTEG